MQVDGEIWSCIPVAEFEAPAPPPGDAALGRMTRLWKMVQGIFRSRREAKSKKSPRGQPSCEVLQAVSPDPDWNQAATSLATVLGEDWFAAAPSNRPRRALVGPPGCGITKVLRALAEQRQFEVLTPPTGESILAASGAGGPDLDALDESAGRILLIPHLEHWFLRHEEGLTLTRNLMERLLISRRPTLIGCDSWAWAFLQHAIGIEEMFDDPLTFAPFDAPRLDSWLRSTLDFQRYEFRQSGDNEPVFSSATKSDHQAAQGQGPCSPMIKSLAAKSRGNPGVGLGMWRERLREQDPDDPDADAADPQAKRTRSVMWVDSPNELGPPELLDNADRVHQFILHAALLHGGLPSRSLVTLLPFARDEIQRRVSELRRGGILEEDQERLRVTLSAYPCVRQNLSSEGFLTDAF